LAARIGYLQHVDAIKSPFVDSFRKMLIAEKIISESPILDIQSQKTKEHQRTVAVKVGSNVDNFATTSDDQLDAAVKPRRELRDRNFIDQ